MCLFFFFTLVPPTENFSIQRTYVESLYSFVHLCIHLTFIESYDVTNNIPKVIEIKWWAKIDKIHALVNLHLQVKCG